MTSYFRRQSRPVVASVEQPAGTRHTEADAIPDERWAPSTSILIFPSPSSTLPPTPASSNGPLPHSPGSASMSNFSLPTSISVDSNLESASENSATSSYRRIRLRRQEPLVRPTGGTTASANTEMPSRYTIPQRLEVELESVSETSGNLDVELWEWSQTSSQQPSPDEDASLQERLLRSLHTAHYPGGDIVEISWPSNSRQRTISQFTNISQFSYISHSTTSSASQSPPTPMYFPFISLIKQLLGIDPETMMLLGALGRSSGAEADLFLSSPFDNSESRTKAVSTIPESIDHTDSTHHPVIALLTQSTVESSQSTSARSLKAGLCAVAEYESDLGESTPSGFQTILLSLTPGAPENIQNLLLSPVKLTTSLASSALNVTTGIIGHSSNTVGTALGAVSRPIMSAVGWSRSETVPTSA